MAPVISSCPPRKRQLAAALRAVGATAAAAAWEHHRPALRIVNYHSVPSRFVDAFAAQVQSLARSWTFTSPGLLPDLLASGVDRQTLLFCFDDGLSNTIDNAIPILEAAGGHAILAVPATWPDVAEPDRADWFRRHVYPVPTELHDHPNDVAAPSWEELRGLVSRGHEVWSHGVDHVQLRVNTPDDVLEHEIVESKAILERQLGTTVRGYCPPIGYTVPPRALTLIADTYELGFGGRPTPVPMGGPALQIPRSNIEASWPWSAVELQLSPLGDALSRTIAGIRS